jgi:tRNA dimethylallyltransferase
MTHAAPAAVILQGATATGKTALAVALAARLPLEAISADSRQVYRHLDIGTAKPAPAERRALTHHLIDCIELGETYNAARFAGEARALCAAIAARQRIPLIVGGAGFYLSVLRHGLFESPFSAEELARVRAEVATWSTAAIRSELAARDPQRLAAIHANDRYRLSRALEICLASGRSVTELTAERRVQAPRFLEFRLVRPRAELHRRIAARTEAMLQAGWLDEVAALLLRFDPQLPGFATLGYPHVIAHLRGEIDRTTLLERVARDTRRFARHQEVWFRKSPATQVDVHGESADASGLAVMEHEVRTAFDA